MLGVVGNRDTSGEWELPIHEVVEGPDAVVRIWATSLYTGTTMSTSGHSLSTSPEGAGKLNHAHGDHRALAPSRSARGQLCAFCEFGSEHFAAEPAGQL